MDDTIAAIATPLGEGGIGIVRMSGPEAWSIASQIFRRNTDKNNKRSIQGEMVTGFVPKPWRLYYGYIFDENNNIIDEVLLSYMPAPSTYTCEEIVEINAHGGLVPLKQILQLLIGKGARLAKEGEFTRRAYINGRIDLLQAESVLTLIRAKTEKGLQAALQTLRGYFSEEIKQIRLDLLDILAEIEADVDFPLEELDFNNGHYQMIKDKIFKVKGQFEIYRDRMKRGRILQEGLKVVIAGKPNVGKSSLYNYFIGEDRAIVTGIPGTTRDLLVEYININGVPIKIIDTAGLRKGGDQIEIIGMGHSRKAIAAAELILFMVDLSSGVTEEDRWIYDDLLSHNEIPIFIVANKLDLVKEIYNEIKPEMYNIFPNENIFEISIVENRGLIELENAISGLIIDDEVTGDEIPLIIEVKLADIFEKAVLFLEDAFTSLEADFPLDIVSIDLKQVFHSLGELLGEETGEEILDHLFSRFCIGK